MPIQICARQDDHMASRTAPDIDADPLAMPEPPGAEYPGPVPESPAPEPPIEVREVGILFVHGMGKHQRGDFLRQVGEPLYDWLAAWLGQEDLDVRHRVLRARETSFRVPHREDEGGPAHSVVETIVVGADGRRRQITWWAVDGLWADEVVAPTFGQVASWGLGLAPWMIVRYFRRHWRGILVVPALLLVLVFQLVILALSVFGAVPKLRQYVAGLQLRITGSIGDVMVMVANPLQFNAMTTRIVSDLRWLQEQIPEGRIAVVAHSQGTGVAHAALQASHVPVDLFATFGTALEKLHLARQVQQNPRRLAIGSSLTIAGGLMLALAGSIVFRMPAPDLTASASAVGRILMGVGAGLLMARMGLWFHLGRLGGWLLTLAGIAILVTGFVLTGAAKTGADGPWASSLRAMSVSRFWEAWTINGWHGLALGLLAVSTVIVLARESVASRTPHRALDGTPQSRQQTRRHRHTGPLGRILDPGSVSGSLLASTVLVIALFCVALATPPDESSASNTALFLIVAGLGFCFAAVPLPIADITEPTARTFRIPRREARMRWHNYWSSADPVPDGDLPVAGTAYVTNHELMNQNSILGDHTSYTDNREEFIADLTLRLSALAGWNAIRHDDLAPIEQAQRRRRWRVRFLTADRWMATLGTVVAWWLLGAAGLTIFGRPVTAVLGYFVGILPGLDSESVQRWLPQAALGMVTVATIAYFWYRTVVRAAWRYWDLVEADILARRERDDAALVRERGIAVTLYAFASAIGLCCTLWSPKLLQLLIDMPVIHPLDRSEDSSGSILFHQWPWRREGLLSMGLWGVPLPVIAIAIVVVALLYAGLIKATIRENSAPIIPS